MLDHRVQILLDDERYGKVAREAHLRGQSIAAIIRDAIDRMPSGAAVRRAAVDAILAAEPMAVPLDPVDLREEVDAGRSRLQR